MVSATVVGFAMMVCAHHCRKIPLSVVDWALRPYPAPRDGGWTGTCFPLRKCNLEWPHETNLRFLRFQSGGPSRVPRCR
jgi:hypothetical protein